MFGLRSRTGVLLAHLPFTFIL